MVVPGGVFVDLGLGVGGVVGVAHVLAHRVLGLVQEWLLDERFSASRLAFVTRGAVAVESGEVVGVGEGVGGLVQAPMWGLVRSAQSENPDRFVLVDVDEDPDSLGALAGIMAAAVKLDEPQLAIRRGVLLAPRLARMVSAGSVGDSDPVGGVVSVFDRGSTVLITGGTGGLGGLVARHLVIEYGVERLLLVSRRGLDAPGALELQQELESLGAGVRIVACDVGDRGELEGIIGSVGGELPLRGVVHTAGVFDNGLIDSLTAERIDGVFVPKVDAAWYLHELTEHLDLQMFVLFSSIAGIFGGPGQGNYAAGNVFLDALAAHRCSRGLVATSMVWPLWSEVGAGRYLDELAMRRTMGSSSFGALSSQEGIEFFDAARATGKALVLPVHLDTVGLGAEARAGTLPALLRGLARVSPRRSSQQSGSLVRRLAATPEAERERMVCELVQGEVATVLGHASPDAIDARLAFRDLGFDSLAAVELRNRLNNTTGLRLPATLIFDYPTPAALAGYLLGAVVPDEPNIGSAAEVELDKLESVLSVSTLGDSERTRVTVRLRALLAELDETQLPGGSTVVAQKIQGASADEVFEFIDKGLGSLESRDAGTSNYRNKRGSS